MAAPRYATSPVSRTTKTYIKGVGSVDTPSRTGATQPGDTTPSATAYGLNQNPSLTQPPTSGNLQTLQQVVTFTNKFPQSPYYGQIVCRLDQGALFYAFYNGQWDPFVPSPLPLSLLPFFGVGGVSLASTFHISFTSYVAAGNPTTIVWDQPYSSSVSYMSFQVRVAPTFQAPATPTSQTTTQAVFSTTSTDSYCAVAIGT